MFFLQDPCRPGVRDAVELCTNSGVKVCVSNSCVAEGHKEQLETVQVIFASNDDCICMSCVIYILTLHVIIIATFKFVNY